MLALGTLLRAGQGPARCAPRPVYRFTAGRFAVMQHLGVLADAGVVLIGRRGRDRVNHLNPVPLREWYERWVQPMTAA